MNIVLNDEELRMALRQYLARLATPPQKIVEELHVHHGQAIADVVAIYNEAHCYEIKGDNDNISRLKVQGKFYDKVFRKTTLVTTTKHRANALRTAPAHWGILIIEFSNDKPKIKSLRGASSSPCFDKEKAVQTLWRNEMLELISKYDLPVSTKLNKRDLATSIASSLSIPVISKDVAKLLTLRTSPIGC
ncbi:MULTISPECIES: sce7726 family protein [unclassified Citrobacter]|uniref:sce7726 family protein n=1 Tax=Enterobacteriaceae TaxID=543 RepID=UPI00129B5886|nr:MULTISPECIES: sce7726 family protein [unclassified Citrobacter]EFV2049902.1 sce7726 family protein [Salmonella enterica]